MTLELGRPLGPDKAMRDGPTSRNMLYLLGATTQAEFQNYVGSLCTSEESVRLPELFVRWHSAAQTFQGIVQTDQGAVGDQEVLPLDLAGGLGDRLEMLRNDPLFQQSFSSLPIEFGLVKIGNLIAAQRAVNVDYVAALQNRLPEHPGMGDLFELCLGSDAAIEEPASLQQGNGMFIFSSGNSDFRFLGGFTRGVEQSDMLRGRIGGQPVSAIVLLVGYGARALNVLSTGGRLVLNNGFHRAYALQALGITHVPAVIQRVSNVDLEFPPNVAGLPREYLLNHPRPALMKDFLNDDLVVKLQERARRKTVRAGLAVEQFDLPV
jgi:hypothetical protein